MELSGPPTWELMKALVPTRPEKKKIAGALRLKDESLVYKWCEDPDGSGRPNPIDKVELLLEHALLLHPMAAFALMNRFKRLFSHAARRASGDLPIQNLVATLQPLSEKEAMEAISEFSRTLRDLVIGEEVDLERLLKEVDEAMRQFQHAGEMLRAAIEARKTEELSD